MKKRTTRFLNISFVLLAVLCVITFTIQTIYINYIGSNAVHNLGVFYVSGISEQVAAHFGTAIELRLSQVESIVNSVPAERVSSDSVMRISLTYNARAAGFEYLALYADDGSFQMIYGSQVEADFPEDLDRSVRGGRNNVCAGKDGHGVPVALIGVPANYRMENGGTSVALVAGLPVSYLAETLESNIQGDFIQYSIIRDDGSYVMHNYGVEEDNYFDRVAERYGVISGKTPEQYTQELQNALATDTEYNSEIMLSGERCTIYCTNLPNSDWHLILKVAHNAMNETVDTLKRNWSIASVGGGVLIFGALLIVFLGYFHMTKQHMRELDEARKTAEQAMLTAERSNRAKNEFLSNMSHDIRTPMNGIMGMTSIAIGNLDNPTRVRSCLKRIHLSSRHLLGLVNDMLDMSKIENGSFTLNMEPVSLREIMQNITTVVQTQVQEKSHHFSIYVHDIYYENVCSDRVRLSQILINIVGNAVKYTPDGGSIQVDLYEEESPKGDGYVRSKLRVEDNGIGMSEEFKEKIFDAFAREDYARVSDAAGAGMGMTITKHIVDAMGGTIDVESEQGKGSCFCITMDMEKTMPQEKELCLPECNVLFIEEDETEGELAVSALESIGLHAETVNDAGRAVEMIEKRRTGRAPYQIVMVDWMLNGQSAMQIGKELSERFGSELSVILVIEGEWDELEVKAEKSGISGFLTKPLFRSGLYYGLRPFVDAKATHHVSHEEAPETPDLTGKRVLIAEDNELNWEIASEMLGECGLESEWAENGQICVEMLEASEPGRYDAVLMDLRMPVMTGFEAAEAIRALEREDLRDIPIIAISADAFEDDVQKCLDSGMNAHTAKPIDTDIVTGLLGEYLR